MEEIPSNPEWTKSEIVLYARTQGVAQKALHTIIDSYALLCMEREPHFADLSVKFDNGDNPKWPLPGHPRFSALNLDSACHIAAKASRHSKFVYALALYRLTQSLYSTAVMDLEPRYHRSPHRSILPIDHARFAYAIVTAYAALETLDVGLSGEAMKNGKWIPRVRQEFERRLQRAGVDVDSPVLLLLRGGKGRLELDRWPKDLPKSESAWGSIRDCEAHVADAIFQCVH